jgi:two-component system chemotaxis response regulator CheB
LNSTATYNAVVIGASAGGIDALTYLLPHIPGNCSCAFFVVQHIHPNTGNYFLKMLNETCNVKVREACSTENIKPGIIYFAPPDYHLMVEKNYTLTLSMDEKVNFSRPSIDVLFDTAAASFKEKLTGILLTGSNSDGSKGLKNIHNMGGNTIVQDPLTAAFGEMPGSALKLFNPMQVLSLKRIAGLLSNLQ